MNIDKTQAETSKNYGTAYLTFMNLKGSAYRKGNIIVEQTLTQEDKKSPLCELASFTDMVVEDCAVNEANNGMNISVCVNAIGKDNMMRLYEWLKKYTEEDKISAIAPGLLESLEIKTDDQVNEDSVASRFSKYRKLYESDDDEKIDEKKEDDKKPELNEGDDKADEKNSEDDKPEDDKKEDEDDKTEDDKKEDNNSEDDEEEEELTAVIIEVAKGDEDAAKQEMIDAGVDEDDIEIIKEDADEKEEDEDTNEGGDDDSSSEGEETVKIKVAVDSFDALKEYLEGKGFDLEEELGGEIVTDDDEDGDKDGDKDDEEMEDTFAGFDDLFGDIDDSDSSEDDKK